MPKSEQLVESHRGADDTYWINRGSLARVKKSGSRLFVYAGTDATRNTMPKLGLTQDEANILAQVLRRWVDTGDLRSLPH